MRFRAKGLGILGFRVWGLGFRVSVLYLGDRKSKVLGVGSRV